MPGRIGVFLRVASAVVTRHAAWCACALLLGALLLACSSPDDPYAFIDRHWRDPVPAQGDPPPGRAPLEASLDAAQCGQCHPDQYQAWRHSRHAHTMAAGILWQFAIFDQASSNECLHCHAPLAEQKALLALDRQWPARPSGPPPDYVPADLHLQGVTCAACHVRGHARFGPPPREGTDGRAAGLPHGGFVATTAFGDSRFCSVCHQFADDGPRLNGKLRQDTYNEWKSSRHADAGVTCQHCHMPGRRHEWRGIGDPEMVRQALSVALDAAITDDGQVRLGARITNTGAGHLFPTYLVPRVDVRLWLEPPDGPPKLVAEHAIQWRASIDLDREIFDHRLAVDQSVVLEDTIPRPEAGDRHIARLTIDVAPKEHYERVYIDMLQQADGMERSTLRLLRQALAEAHASRFRAIEITAPIPSAAGLQNAAGQR